jgi:hypothetical protein
MVRTLLALAGESTSLFSRGDEGGKARSGGAVLFRKQLFARFLYPRDTISCGWLVLVEGWTDKTVRLRGENGFGQEGFISKTDKNRSAAPSDKTRAPVAALAKKELPAYKGS